MRLPIPRLSLLHLQTSTLSNTVSCTWSFRKSTGMFRSPPLPPTLGSSMIQGKRVHRTRQIQYKEMRMLKSVSILLAVACLLAAGKAEGRGCSVASLKGDYGFALLGTRPSGPPPAAIEQMIGRSGSEQGETIVT